MPALVRRLQRRLSEFQLIRDIERRFSRKTPGVIRGIGDDAAILRLPPGSDLLLTTDLLAEGVHFDRTTARWEDIGYKAVMANVSDIAAMGGRPGYLVVSMALPETVPSSAVRALYRGIAQACGRTAATLVGGDTSASRQDVFLSLALTGLVGKNRALRRDGARVGDDVYVTGTLGDAAAGLALLTGASRRAKFLGTPAQRAFLIRRHRRPEARVDEGRWLADHRLATAAIDLSDGLSGDLAHLCAQSRVGVEIEADALPLSAACRAYALGAGCDAIQLALSGGEDYELLFTARPAHRRALQQMPDMHVTRIGTIRPASFGRRVRRGPREWAPLRVTSYEHFR